MTNTTNGTNANEKFEFDAFPELKNDKDHNSSIENQIDEIVKDKEVKLDVTEEVKSVPVQQVTQSNQETQSGQESVEEMRARINRPFYFLEKFSQAVQAGAIKGLLATGAAGMGKTHTVEQALNHSLAYCSQTTPFVPIKGHITPLQFFIQLQKNNEPGKVLLIDDSDGLFQEEEGLNLLKIAMERKDKRVISYHSSAQALDKVGLKKSFEYQGAVIAISNMNFKERKRNKAHIEAVVDRCVHIDLGCHKPDEKMCRINYVVENHNLLSRIGLEGKGAQMVIDFVYANRDHLELSLRTVELAGDIFQMYHFKLEPEEIEAGIGIDPEWEEAVLMTRGIHNK